MSDMKVFYRPLSETKVELFPAPFVSRSFEPVEAGALRLGFMETYEVAGFLSGKNTTGYNSSAAFNSFSKSPGVLSIGTGTGQDGEFLAKSGFVVSFSIPKNNFLSSSGLFPYSLKFKTFDTMRNIKSPSFEYSFTENQDRSVGLGVKISAQGLVSIYDAKAFVEDMASSYNLTGFAPVYITTGSNWSLYSSKKTVDRTKFTYSLEREYLCVPSGYIYTGFPFSENTKVSQKLSSYTSDYPTFEFETNLKILADSGKHYQESKAWSSFESSLFSDKNYLEEISLHYLKRYGALNLNNFLLSNISISKNSGAKEVSLKFDLLSGKASDFSGYFNYSLTTDEDLAMGDRTMSLNGEFFTKGDFTNKRQALEKWMKAEFTPEGEGQSMPYNSGPKLYEYVLGLTGLANGITSGVFGVEKIGVEYNSGMAEFKLTSSMDNKIRIVPGSEISFSIDVQASVPIYKFIPAANIEGHYIIQDLMSKTAETAKIDVNGKADKVANISNFFGTGVKIVSELFNGFIRTDFTDVEKITTAENYIKIFPESLSVSSGLADASFSINYGVMYSGNKNYNHEAFRGIPELQAGNSPPIGAVKATQSIRTRHLFGR